MLRGQLWATSDIEMVNQALMQGFKVIYLGDPISIDPVYKEKLVVASALVPDYQTLSLQVDGNLDAFINMYVASLNSNAAMEMLSVIMMCLYKGINILFYLPKEAEGLNYVQYLLQYIELNFGVTAQTQTTHYAFNPEYFGRIVELLYLKNLITAQDYLINSTTLDELTIRKLVSEIHPVVDDPTDISKIVAWFSKYKDELIKAGRPLINGIQYAGEDSDYGCY